MRFIDELHQAYRQKVSIDQKGFMDSLRRAAAAGENSFKFADERRFESAKTWCDKQGLKHKYLPHDGREGPYLIIYGWESEPIERHQIKD